MSAYLNTKDVNLSETVTFTQYNLSKTTKTFVMSYYHGNYTEKEILGMNK